MERKHKKEYYTCKRMRLLQYLTQHGFTPYETIPEPTNPRYNWWLFENTPALEKCLDEYFQNLKKRAQ